MIPIQYATFTELSLRGDTPTERQMCRRQMVCRRQTIWATANWATHCGQHWLTTFFRPYSTLRLAAMMPVTENET